MINEILHVRSRCGAGKSLETISELVDHLNKQETLEDTFLFASKTNELTGQNYEEAHKANAKHCNKNALPIVRVDSEERKSPVIKEIAELLNKNFKGIVFISHSALSLLPAELLRGVKIVVDEVPQELAGCLMVKHAAKDQGYPWEKYLHEVPSNHKGYTAVEIRPNEDHDEIRQYIDRIRQQKDTTTTCNVAEMLDFLLKGYEVVYTTTTQSDGSSERLFQAIHYHRLMDLIKHADFLAILSAQLRQTFFGYIAQNHIGLPIVERDINDKTLLDQKHKHRVRIIPFLAKGRWSASLKQKPAIAALTKNGQPTTSETQVGDFAQQFASSILGSEDFLITLNQDEKLIKDLDRAGVTETSTAVHGMNHLRHLDHAVYLAATNPTPFEVKSLRMFSKNHNLTGDELLDAVTVERCYEAAYQCVARTSIRNQQHDPSKEHIIIVPDMRYAAYLSEWFDNSATVDTQYSYATQYEDRQNNEKENRRNIVTHILTQKANTKHKLKDLVEMAGISRSTFKRYREEFRPELEAAGLIKPKRQQATKQSA